MNSKRGRLWWARTTVSHELLSDAAFEAFLLMCSPEDAGPSIIVRIHVDPSDDDGMCNLRVYGRERDAHSSPRPAE